MKHTIVRGMKRLLSGFVVTALLITTGAVMSASAAAGSGRSPQPIRKNSPGRMK